MIKLKAYVLRCFLFGPACAATLWLFYRDKPLTPADNPPVAYFCMSLLFTLCALCGWLARIRSPRFREVFSASMIAGMIALGLIMLSAWQPTDNIFYMSYFYDDSDYLLLFNVAGVCMVALYTGLLCFLPDTEFR